QHGARRGIEGKRFAKGGGGIDPAAIAGEAAAKGTAAVLALGHERTRPDGAAALSGEGPGRRPGIENENPAAGDDRTCGEPSVAAGALTGMDREAAHGLRAERQIMQR